MIDYILLGATIVLIIFYSLLSSYLNFLTAHQMMEMTFGVILFILILGFLRSYLLDLNTSFIFIPAFFFINWYFWTKFMANNINRDKTGIIRES